MQSTINLNESEIHVLRLAINTCQAEWDEYLNDPKVESGWGITQAVIKRGLLLKRLSLRLEDLSKQPVPTSV